MSTPGGSPAKLPTAILALASGLVAFVLACYVVLIVTNHDTTGVTVLLSTTLPTAGISLYTALQTIRNRGVVQAVASRMETVVQQTNGALHGPLAQIAQDTAAIRETQTPTITTEGGITP